MREDLLVELGFPDPYITLKKRENEHFLGQLSDRFAIVDSLKDFDDAMENVVRGLLAGNVFDWGAKAVTDILDNHAENIIPFEKAQSKLQARPWLVDDLAEFVASVR